MNMGCSFPFRQILLIIISALLMGSATPVTAMQGYQTLLSPGMATEQKSDIENITHAQIRKLKSYRVGITTERSFLMDGWNARDPWMGKLGIVQFTNHDNKYRMGIFTTKNQKMGDIAQQLYELVKISDGESLLRVIDKRGDNETSKHTLCMLAFKDGILVKNSCR